MATDEEIAAKRKKRADYMREYERRKGAVPLKGVLFSCLRCGADFERNSAIQKFCPNCQRPAHLENKAAKRAAAGHVAIGTPMVCKHCGAQCMKIQRRQFYCEPCMALNAEGKLPAAVEWMREYQREYQKKRRQESPQATIHARMTAGIKNSLRDGKAGRSWESLVGYTVEDLMRHLERQFLSGMTWENRGDWHIDHIVPLKCFQFETPVEPDFRAAWALTNLRPLWELDNLKKSGHRHHLI
jgi:hypothetical protein